MTIKFVLDSNKNVINQIVNIGEYEFNWKKNTTYITLLKYR